MREHWNLTCVDPGYQGGSQFTDLSLSLAAVSVILISCFKSWWFYSCTRGWKRSAHHPGFTEHLSGSVSEVCGVGRVGRVGRVEGGGGVSSLARQITLPGTLLAAWLETLQICWCFTHHKDSCVFQVGAVLQVRVIRGTTRDNEDAFRCLTCAGPA